MKGFSSFCRFCSFLLFLLCFSSNCPNNTERVCSSSPAIPALLFFSLSSFCCVLFSFLSYHFLFPTSFLQSIWMVLVCHLRRLLLNSALVNPSIVQKNYIRHSAIVCVKQKQHNWGYKKTNIYKPLYVQKIMAEIDPKIAEILAPLRASVKEQGKFQENHFKIPNFQFYFFVFVPNFCIKQAILFAV